MNVIYPKPVGGRWYFDGPQIDALPYYFNDLGMNDIIARLAAELSVGQSGFRLTFSDQAFTQQKLTLARMQPESGGYWYYSEELKLMGWLGPELKNYFTDFPQRIHLSHEPLES